MSCRSPVQKVLDNSAFDHIHSVAKPRVRPPFELGMRTNTTTNNNNKNNKQQPQQPTTNSNSNNSDNKSDKPE